MVSLLSKIIPALIFWGIWIYVIFFTEYPKSLTEASIFQLLSFFIPLFLALTLTLNIFLKSIIRSILISFGIIILLVLKALDSLNIVSALLTIIAVGLLFSYFRKPSIKSELTSGSNIPKLTKLRSNKSSRT